MASQINEIYGAVARIEQMVKDLKDNADKRELRDEKLEQRVRRVENRQTWYSGVAAAVGLIFGGVGSGLIRH